MQGIRKREWNCKFCQCANDMAQQICNMCEVPKGHYDMTTVPGFSQSNDEYRFNFYGEIGDRVPTPSFNNAAPRQKSIYGVMENERRILLIGKTGVGKSATGNNILGKKVFESKMLGRSVTKKSEIGRADRFGKKLLLVDTPGIFDTGTPNEETMKEIVKCIGMTSPGLHAIILVVKIDRFTEEEKKTVDLFLSHLGDDLVNYLIVVFTRRDDIERHGTTIKEYLDSLEPESLLREVLYRNQRRFVAFDNTATGTQNDNQVKELLAVIDALIIRNGGSFYSNEMYEAAEKAFRNRMDEERARLKREEEEKIQAILAPLQAKIEAERREREVLSQNLAANEKLTKTLSDDRSRIEAELERAREKNQRDIEDRERETRRLQEEMKREHERHRQKMDELEDEYRRREQRMRDNEARQIQNEDERRRYEKAREEEMERCFRKEREEFEKRLSEAQKQEIKKIREEYADKSSDRNLRERNRDAIQKEEPGILRKIVNAVSEIPVIGPIAKGVGAVLSFFGI